MRRVIALACALGLAIGLTVTGPVAGFSSNGRCLGLMVQVGTVELRPGFWTEGPHSLDVRYVDPMFDVDFTSDRVAFDVSTTAPVRPGQVHVGDAGLISGYTILADQTINPRQDTVLFAGVAWDMTGDVFGGPPSTMQEVRAEAGQIWIGFRIDGGSWIPARLSPPHSVCANGMLADSVEAPLLHRTWGPSH